MIMSVKKARKRVFFAKKYIFLPRYKHVLLSLETCKALKKPMKFSHYFCLVYQQIGVHIRALFKLVKQVPI